MNTLLDFGIHENLVAIRPREFEWIAGFLRTHSGIEIRAGKEALVMGRLDRRLRHHGCRTYAEYFRMLGPDGDRDETRLVLDLLTTNETYFFREPKHFEVLAEVAPELLAARGPLGTLRAWSAASSSGEEAYSIAMVLAETIGDRFEILGTDLSRRVVDTARRALYPIDAADNIPVLHRSEYCLRGRDEYDGVFTVRPDLRARVTFEVANLHRPLPDLGDPFDVVFLRNVLIYFAPETKTEVLRRVIGTIRPGGLLFVGHAETITGLHLTGVTAVRPSVYRIEPR